MLNGFAMVASVVAMLSGMSPDGYIYPETGIVTQVDYSTNTVTFTTCEQVPHYFTGCEDWDVGDICSAIMYSPDQYNVFDDQVLSAVYSGRVEWLPTPDAYIYDYPAELLTAGE